MIIAPLCSSSTANSTYIGDKASGILIDIGCSYKKLRGYLAACDLSVENIKAVFITHEHTDHIAGLSVFMKNNPDVPVCLGGRMATEEGLIKKTLQVLDYEITAFDTPHDTDWSVGYVIKKGDYKIAYMTDLGHITQEVRAATGDCDLAFIESNYDSDMLWGGSYHYHLKQRVDSKVGHLSNADTADYIQKLVETRATRIVLGHLSRQNNTPALAYDCTAARLANAGMRLNRDFTLDVANVVTAGQYIAI
jgi:phosphoribosyl 1,2-cyclic phosphodiesterase